LHEEAVVTELRSRLPHAHVVASHEVSPEFREYERASTTTADAYLGPVVSRYLHGLIAAAAGVVGAARRAALAGITDAMAFDMGGTSTDVCVITAGRAERASERSIDGLPLRLPTVDLHTVGAGGGSIVWRDAGGALRVGPRSAGASPGPACYGLGGREGTVTDANLLLGRVPGRLAGGVELDREAAERALAGVDPAAVVDVVNAEMLRALRVVSVERGHDPSRFALVAFGGAGPLHACELADELGIVTVLVPEVAGVLSALGLVASEERRDFVRSHLVPLADAEELPRDGEADLRYAGQSFELTLPLQDDLAGAFHRAHEAQYGFAERERTIELVAVRTAEVRAGPELQLPAGAQTTAAGPAVVELPGSTCWVPPGWVGVRDGRMLLLTRT
jgi:N-methylhydantoinase A